MSYAEHPVANNLKSTTSLSCRSIATSASECFAQKSCREKKRGGQTAHTQPLSIRSQQVLNVSKRQQDAESLTWEAEPRPRRDPAQTLSSYKELWVSDGDTRSTVCLLDFHLYFSPDVLLFEQHSSACFPRTSFAAVHTHKFNKIVVIKYIQLLSVS